MASGFPTLRDYKAGNQGRIYAWCGNNLCQHGEELDIDRLIDRLGPDFEVSAATMNRRLRCSKCGGRNCRINLPGDQRSGLAPRGATGKKTG